MFPFFPKNKETEKKDTPPFYDVHNHCLYGLDDGAKDLEASRVILEGLYNLGFRGVIATPHYDHPRFPSPTRDSIEQRLSALRALDPTRVPQLIAGGEITVRDHFHEVLNRGEYPDVCNTFLIEFGHHPGAIGPGIEEGLFSMIARGHTPILAHVERYAGFQEHPGLLTRCRQRGAILQLDLMSLDGQFGERTRSFSKHLLEQGLIDIAATDIHSPEELPAVERSLVALRQYGTAEIERLLSTNPGAIFHGHPEDIVSR